MIGYFFFVVVGTAVHCTTPCEESTTSPSHLYHKSGLYAALTVSDLILVFLLMNSTAFFEQDNNLFFVKLVLEPCD